MPDSDWYWRVSQGIGNAAMPQWRLLLSEQDRWDAIKYIKATFSNPSEPTDVSDEVPPAVPGGRSGARTSRHRT